MPPIAREWMLDFLSPGFVEGYRLMSENSSDEPEVVDQLDKPSGVPFLVVGVGASAGGLSAYSELLEGFSANPGLALLLVSHLDPGQKSLLAPILNRVSQIPVIEATEGMAVEVDHVYVIPPATNMALTDGHLTLSPRMPSPLPHMPIDHLLRSLATIQKGRSAAVILSGGGSDGAIALQTIKAHGGVTFAQSEATARHTSMPRSAVQDGNVDHVLPPAEIARTLERIARHPYARESESQAVDHTLSLAPASSTTDIVNLVRQRTSVDFTNYKQTTIRRRIFRRMALRGIQEPAEYLLLLRSDAKEVQDLLQDFLIRVTQFFRDPESFESLKTNVLPAIIDGRTPGSTIRVWVAGCATGEEAYSIAISLLEYLEDRPEKLVIKVLATDLNEVALEKARAGIYLDNIEIDVSPQRLRRFFVRQEGYYQISKAVRELCIFSKHNLTADPPFSRLDLISCRNVLIYMDVPLQKRIIPLLHYALNSNGFLFLGTSESVGSSRDLFDVIDARNRFFARSPILHGLPVNFSHAVAAEGQTRRPGREDPPLLWNALDVQKEADRILLNRYAPVGVVVDESMTVLQFRGRTAPYLEPAPGMASLDLLRMLREGLLSEVRLAVTKAKSENAIVVREGIRLSEGDSLRVIRVDVLPFKVPLSGVRFFLILFQQSALADQPAVSVNSLEAVEPSDDERTIQLQHEINSLREYLQSVIEVQESTNEELKSANEEILSSNEELQSTNEELQTAKEEAQSANEELATVNDELRHRNNELGRLNDDLVNLFSGVNIPIIMLSRNLRIRRFTPMAEKTFNLIPSDVGRPISDIKSNLRIDDLAGVTNAVIDSLVPYESDVEDMTGRRYSLRIRPYITLDRKIEGASIVLVEVASPRQVPVTLPAPETRPPDLA